MKKTKIDPKVLELFKKSMPSANSNTTITEEEHKKSSTKTASKKQEKKSQTNTKTPSKSRGSSRGG